MPGTSTVAESIFDALSDEQIEQFREIFNFFDKDGSGFISVRELSETAKFSSIPLTDAEIKDFINAYDINGDGEIDFEEFVVLMGHKIDTVQMEEEIIDAFKIFDADNDGFVSVEEFKSVMEHFDATITYSECEEIIRSYDEDGDMKLNFLEFHEMMCRRRQDDKQSEAGSLFHESL